MPAIVTSNHWNHDIFKCFPVPNTSACDNSGYWDFIVGKFISKRIPAGGAGSLKDSKSLTDF